MKKKNSLVHKLTLTQQSCALHSFLALKSFIIDSKLNYMTIPLWEQYLFIYLGSNLWAILGVLAFEVSIFDIKDWTKFVTLFLLKYASMIDDSP